MGVARLFKRAIFIGVRACLKRLCGLSGKTSRHQARHGKADHRLTGVNQVFIVFAQAPVTTQPGESAFNGLITNDKFCLTRTGRLTLTWSRRRPQSPDRPTGDATYPSDGNSHRGGTYETPVEHSPRTETGPGWSTPMGPGLPVPSAMDAGERAGARVRLDSDAGGVR
jgi:hypothetical protein